MKRFLGVFKVGAGAGNELGKTDLHDAASGNQVEVVKISLTAGANCKDRKVGEAVVAPQAPRVPSTRVRRSHHSRSGWTLKRVETGES